MLVSSIKGLLWKIACLEAWLVGSQRQDMLLSCLIFSMPSSAFLLCEKVSLSMSSNRDLSSTLLPFIRRKNRDTEAASVYFLWKHILTKKCIQTHSAIQDSVDMFLCNAMRQTMRKKLYYPCAQRILRVTGVTVFFPSSPSEIYYFCFEKRRKVFLQSDFLLKQPTNPPTQMNNKKLPNITKTLKKWKKKK